MVNKREIAKFFCGFETFHALVNAYFWLSGSTLSVFGIAETPTLSMIGALINGFIAIWLGIYGWRRT